MISQRNPQFPAAPLVQDRRRGTFDVIRVPAHRELHVTVISSELLSCRLHYYNNRSWLCSLQKDCEHCQQSPWTKVESYAYVLDGKNIRILALPHNPSLKVAEVERERGALDGVQFRLSRKGGKRSSIRVEVFPGARPGATELIPLLLPLKEVMLKILS